MTDVTDTIVLIHGLWMTPLAWEHWVERYEARGFNVLTPGYPGIEPGTEGVAALREDASGIADVGVREVIDHIGQIIQDLDTTPIIMGHSFGGTFAQMLLDAGLGSAGVSIDGAGVKGVNALPFSEFRSTVAVLKDPLNVHRAVPLTAKQFHYAFTNTQDEAASQAAYDRYAVPTPARILFQGGLAAVTHNAATTYNFANDDRAPLLFISGGSDHILPPSVQRENYDKNAKHSTAVSAHVVFDGRDHFTCGEPGWEKVADFALDWALDPSQASSTRQASPLRRHARPHQPGALLGRSRRGYAPAHRRDVALILWMCTDTEEQQAGRSPHDVAAAPTKPELSRGCAGAVAGSRSRSTVGPSGSGGSVLRRRQGGSGAHASKKS